MTFKLNINEHDVVTYVKIQLAGKSIHEAALLAYYTDGPKKRLFNDDLEREINDLLTLLGLTHTAQKEQLEELIENHQYQIENLRAALRVIEDLGPREIEDAWTVATRAIREDDEFAARAVTAIR